MDARSRRSSGSALWTWLTRVFGPATSPVSCGSAMAASARSWAGESPECFWESLKGNMRHGVYKKKVKTFQLYQWGTMGYCMTPTHTQLLQLYNCGKVHNFQQKYLIAKYFIWCPSQILWDRKHKTGCDRWLEAKGGYPESGGQDSRVQAAESNHVRLGDQRQAPGWGSVWQRHGAQRQFHKQVAHGEEMHRTSGKNEQNSYLAMLSSNINIFNSIGSNVFQDHPDQGATAI